MSPDESTIRGKLASGRPAGANERAADLLAERTRERDALRADLDALLYAISHDLRAPVRAIDGFAAVLEADAGPSLQPEVRESLRFVRDGARRLSLLTDALTSLGTVARQTMRREPVDMDRLVRSIAAECIAHARPRVIRCEIAPLPACIGDPTLLDRAWRALIDNAVKFTGPSPDPAIRIDAEREGTPGPPRDRIAYRIRDNGVGFDERLAAKLFRPFQRLHAADRFPGVGIGLAIVREVVQRHGGEVRASAAPARDEGDAAGGATFSMILPASGTTEEGTRHG